MMNNKTIWVDLDNSPHVLFFEPIIPELHRLGFNVEVTARNVLSIKKLCQVKNIKAKYLGNSFGRFRFTKIVGTLFRATQFFQWLRFIKPVLGLSLGSRSQILACNIAGVQTLEVSDYEHSKTFPFLEPTFLMAPRVIPEMAFPYQRSHFIGLDGLKEQVYIPFMKTDPQIRDTLKCQNERILVTVRPPATEAHYHDSRSEELLIQVMNHLLGNPLVFIVLLLRNETQNKNMRRSHLSLMSHDQVYVPTEPLDGLNLMIHSDIVISGGGTMNREASCMGVPVYSIFSGQLGCVDRSLEMAGKLVILRNSDDITQRLIIEKNPTNPLLSMGEKNCFKSFIEVILQILAKEHSGSYKA